MPSFDAAIWCAPDFSQASHKFWQGTQDTLGKIFEPLTIEVLDTLLQLSDTEGIAVSIQLVPIATWQSILKLGEEESRVFLKRFQVAELCRRPIDEVLPAWQDEETRYLWRKQAAAVGLCLLNNRASGQIFPLFATDILNMPLNDLPTGALNYALDVAERLRVSQ